VLLLWVQSGAAMKAIAVLLTSGPAPTCPRANAPCLSSTHGPADVPVGPKSSRLTAASVPAPRTSLVTMSKRYLQHNAMHPCLFGIHSSMLEGCSQLTALITGKNTVEQRHHQPPCPLVAGRVAAIVVNQKLWGFACNHHMLLMIHGIHCEVNAHAQRQE